MAWYDNLVPKAIGAIREGIFGKVPQVDTSGIMTPFQNLQQSSPQLDAITQLLQQGANGQGPSAAGQLMQAGQDRTASNALGLAQGASGLGGVSGGQALREALRSNQQGGLQAQQQFGAQRSQEQLQQQGALAQLLTQLRQQDIDRAKAQADALAGVSSLQYKPYEMQTQQTGAILGGIASVGASYVKGRAENPQKPPPAGG